MRCSHWGGIVTLKFSKPGFSNTWMMNFLLFKLGLENAEESGIKLPTSIGSSTKAREFQNNIYFCFIDYAKAFDCVDHKKMWKILQDMGIPDHLTCLPRCSDASVCKSRSNVRTNHGTTDWFQIGKKEYVKAVYCHPAYLTSTQSTSWEMLGWKKHKLESRFPGESCQKTPN